jgi:hypothetical protein
MQVPAGVRPAPADQPRDEHHGEDDRQGAQKNSANHAHARHRLSNNARRSFPLTLFCDQKREKD